MKKLLIFLLCAAILTLAVYAHPGGTDSRGGHTDHSSGEYHYHHGYEAHSHYDMDGDGDVDCPYNFRDKSGSSSGSPNNSSSPTDSPTSSPNSSIAGVILGILGVIVYLFFMFVFPMIIG